MKNMVVDTTVLAHVIYPDRLCLDEKLYFKSDEHSWYSYQDKTLYLRANSSVDFGTYFNSFSIGKWRYYTNVENLSLRLKIKGHIILYLHHLSSRHVDKVVLLKEINVTTFSNLEIEVPRDIGDGILYFTIKAIGDAEVKEISWRSDTFPTNRVKLGISITTFKREKAVKASTKRIRSFISDAGIDAHLFVVDNGKSAKDIKSDNFVTYIENENLGGSGGFARGLYEMKKRDGFTHALFMDDDASCENESIYRVFTFLSYAKDPKLAIAGSMLFGDDPHIQWESGADFDEYCRPKKSLFNLHDIHAVCNNEDNQRFDYGGWWFFAFPIRDSQYPFPFFVRGDDVNFGLQKQFTQITLNGVATWGDDFFYKESPLTQYLDMRSHLLHHLQVPHLNSSKITLLRLFWRLYLKYLLLYRYASAEGLLEGVKDTLKGPKFWEENIDMKEIFPKLSPLVQQEKLQKENFLENLDKFATLQDEPLSQKHLLMKIFKGITLNGHLVPKTLFKRRGLMVDKRDHRFGVYFLRKEIFLVNMATQEGVVLKHNKKRFYKLLKEGIVVSIEIIKKRDHLINAYQSAYSYLTSQAYWEKQFFKA